MVRSGSARTSPKFSSRVLVAMLAAVFLLTACGGSGGDAVGDTASEADGTGEVKQVSFILDWIPKGQTSPFLVALEKGFWAKRGLAVQVSRGYGSGDTAVRVGTGEAQFGFAGVSATMNAIQEGLPLIEVGAIAHTHPTTTYALPEAGIDSADDLKGHTVVDNPSGENHAVFQAYCSVAGLDCEKDFEWVLTEQVSVAQLLSGQGDVMLNWITDLGEWWLQDPPLDPTNVWLGKELDIYGPGIIANSELLESDPDTVKAFVEGALEGYQYVLNGGDAAHKESIDALFKYYPDLEDADNAEKLHLANLKLFLSLILAAAEVEESGVGFFEPEKTKRTMDFVNEHLLDEPLELDTAFYTALIDEGAFPIDWEAARAGVAKVMDRDNPILAEN